MPITSQFLTDILSDPNFHIPVEANFVVGFSNLPDILNNLKAKTIPDRILTNQVVWDSIDSNEIFFANGITVPGETVATARAGYSAGGDNLFGGLLSSPVLNGRSNLTNFEITFLETNQSFADQVIRPWIVNASHYGLFARKDNKSKQNFKTEITINFLDKRFKDPKTDHKAFRKTITLKNAVPISIESSPAHYGGSKVAARNIKTSWIYSQYEMTASEPS